MADPGLPLPRTQAAMQAAAEIVRATWVSMAQSGRYFGVNTGSYTAGLFQPESIQYPYEGNPYAALVQNVSPYAQVLEEGHAGFHLPDHVRWGQLRSTHRSKKGVWYIRIPFRHFTPRQGPAGVTPMAQRQMMSAAMYRIARSLRPGERLTAGATRGQAVHAPGLSPYVPAYARNIRPGYTHASIHEGMRRLPAVAPQRGSRYQTWRTMTQNSPGWHIPPRAGTHISDHVALQVTPQLTELLQAAVTADVVDIIAGWFQ